MRRLVSFVRVFTVALTLFVGVSTCRSQSTSDTVTPINIAKVNEAVRKLDATTDARVAAATEAFLAAGVSIWDDERRVIKQPTVERSGLAVTQSEIQTFVVLRSEGVGGRLGDLLNALDYIWKEVGGEGSIREEVREWLRYSPVDPDTSKRGIGALLTALAESHNSPGDADWTDDSNIDALQNFIIMRVFTEDIGVPLREVAKRKMTPFSQGALLEGWSEDGYVGSIGLIVDLVTSNAEKLNKAISLSNLVASITKFIATYKFLKLEMEVEAPGNPLVRTKTTTAGEQRTLAAKVYIDGKAISDWLKENRTTIVAVLPGLDLDAPKSGPLAGVETAWDFDQDRKYASKQLIQTVGRQDISKVVTDEAGKARIQVEGKPQTKNMDPKKVRAVEKVVRVYVTAQVKSTSAQQDIVDAIFGAAGFKDGPGLGILTPIMETLYRMKWNGTRIFKLRVRDWVPATTHGKLLVEVRGNGFDSRRDETVVHEISSTLKVEDFEMEVSGGPDAEVTDIPAELLSKMSAQDREDYKKMLEEMKKESFFATGPGSVELSLKSNYTKRGTYAECEEETVEEREFTYGRDYWVHPAERSDKRSFDWMVVLDRKKGTAIVRVQASCEVETHRTRRSTKSENNVDERKKTAGLLSPGAVLPNEFTVPVKIQESPEEGTLDFIGTASIPFKFGPNQKFTGSILISFSLRKKIDKPK